MKHRGAFAIAAIFGLVGVGLLGGAAATALSHFNYDKLDCGSVISAKDPRDLVSKRATVPRRLVNANRECEKLRSTRSDRATRLLIAGAIPLLVALFVPSVIRASRRSRSRRRV
jgi:hypothetical protein